MQAPVKIYLVEYALFLWSSGLLTFVDQAHNKLQFNAVNTLVCITINGTYMHNDQWHGTYTCITINGTYSTYGLLVAREELLSRELQELGKSLNLEMITSFFSKFRSQ